MYNINYRQLVKSSRCSCRFVDDTDGPLIFCDSVDVEVGQRNVCLRCHVAARPAPTSVYWQVGVNNSDVIADDAHWTIVQVNLCTV